ncbi:VOC family protein [Natronorubrum aibiense]|uniref:Lactoylglutathione lyase n=1 Tax=Natronorubrum aibiense TaxID=348826 RepID=A0A5P9P9A3_9EURY|nr:VOC family protein [Natronorubrum aibiense]QFU84688.1 lactoylglutathione lyase [Natronorubrum aibiense]
MDVLHTAVWIDDIDATTDFYCDGLGLEHTRDFVGDDGATNYYVRGESETEIQFKYDDTDRDLEPSGIAHVAIAVEDIDDTLETLVDEHGSEIVGEPTEIERSNIRIAFATDPSGYIVELVEDLSDDTDQSH